MFHICLWQSKHVRGSCEAAETASSWGCWTYSSGWPCPKLIEVLPVNKRLTDVLSLPHIIQSPQSIYVVPLSCSHLENVYYRLCFSFLSLFIMKHFECRKVVDQPAGIISPIPNLICLQDMNQKDSIKYLWGGWHRLLSKMINLAWALWTQTSLTKKHNPFPAEFFKPLQV